VSARGLVRLGVGGALAAGLVMAGRAQPVPQSHPSPPHLRPGRLLHVVSAEFRDEDGSGDASPGDEVVLQLRRPLADDQTVDLEDVPLVSADDRWGDGAHVSVGGAEGRIDVRVTLGDDPALALYGTYHPGTSGRTVARVRWKRGAVPVLVRPADRRSFVGDLFEDSPRLRPFFGQLHSHTGFSDGVLEPRDAFEMARTWGLDFFAVTDHLEQLTADNWTRGLAAADAETRPGSFVALYGYEWGGFPTLEGWMNHVNVIGASERLGLPGTLWLRGLYDEILALPGPCVVGAFNHPGTTKLRTGRNDWDDFEYHPDADLRMNLIMVDTGGPETDDNRETAGMIPALDRGWHLGPKAEEDNHHADWGRSRVRTGLWIPELTRAEVLAGLRRMATFYTDDPGACLKLTADDRWLMGSTLYGGGGPHELEVEVTHRSRVATVTRVELVSRGGAVVASRPGGRTPLRATFTVHPDSDTYYFARVVLERANVRMVSAPVFIDE
jgi:hypothetical protein